MQAGHSGFDSRKHRMDKIMINCGVVDSPMLQLNDLQMLSTQTTTSSRVPGQTPSQDYPYISRCLNLRVTIP